MKLISIVNQKGGVGKTTSAINIAAQLAKNFDVLLVDLDAQGNTTSGLGVDKSSCRISSTIFFSDIDNANFFIETNVAQLFLSPASLDLINLDTIITEKQNREYLLKNKLNNFNNQFDFVIFDCPPSLGLVTVNALTASDYVLVPVQAEFYALEGLTQLLQTISFVQNNFNLDLDILGVFLTMYDKRTTLAKDVRNEIANFFNDRLLKTSIPRNVRLAEAPSHGLTIYQYDKWSKGAKAYKNLTKEILTRINLD